MTRPGIRWGVLWLMLLGGTGQAAVEVRQGPTPIPAGDAKAAGDVTVMNECLAFSLAVQSSAPYGVPRGALVDLAPITDGKIGRDRVVFADFIPDHWSAWPNTYQHIDVLERGPERAVVRTTRDWGQVTVVTEYTLAAHEDHLGIRVSMTNEGLTPLKNLLSGLALWPNSGFLFAVPGLQGEAEADSSAALAHRVVAYDEHWSIALHADYFDHVGDGSKDLYQLNTLQPGQTRTFEGSLQVSASGDLAPVVRTEIDRRGLAAGSVSGSLGGSGGLDIDVPVVVVERSGKPYAWVVGRSGRYQVRLPTGDYRLYATARNFSESARVDVHVGPDSEQQIDFPDLERPARVEFKVTARHGGQPLDARIAIEQGQKPSVEFLGRQVFFTDIDRRGAVEVPIAPGHYRFRVSSGGRFLGPSRVVDLTLAPGESRSERVELTRLFDPPARGWYAADLHHHADQAEAVTPPADLARSQLAAGLDLLFVSDHDSTVNHSALQLIADRRHTPFMPGVELSPSWGHFNAYPLSPGQPLRVDTSVATVDELFAEARRQGALVIQVNHPFIPYGYFTSVTGGVAPGGFNPGFDAVEINQSAPDDDDKVLHALWDYWNHGRRYVLSAGTDTHDVWNFQSGDVRVFVHPSGPFDARSFALALRAGHAYVSHGPLIFPSVTFGDELRVSKGHPGRLGVDLASVEGLRRVQLIGAGVVVRSEDYSGSPQRAHMTFTLRAPLAAWYSLVVEDVDGNRAYSDPIWVTSR